MLIGLPKEIKNHEYRVGLTPASVRELTTHGHQVLVQKGDLVENCQELDKSRGFFA